MAKIATGSRKSSSATKLSESQRREIERMAYQFYAERGYQNGHHEEDWLRAEAVVRSRRN